MSVVLIASARLEGLDVEAWRALSLDPGALQWPEEQPLLAGALDPAHPTVGKALDAMARLARPSFVGFRPLPGGAMGVVALLEPEVFEDAHEDLVSVLRLAGLAGATGRVVALIADEPLAFVADVGERGRARWVPAEDVFADDDVQQDVSLVEGFGRDGFADPTLSFGDWLAAERTFWVESPPAGARKAVLDALAPHRAALADAATEARTPDGTHSLLKHYGSSAALLSAFDGADPALIVAAIELLSLIDPAAAEPLALLLQGDPSRYVRRAAVRALGHSATERAFVALLDGTDLDTALERRVALASHGWPGADARLLAELDAEWMTPAAQAHDADDPMGAAERAISYLPVLAERGIVAAVPKLLAKMSQNLDFGVKETAAGVLLALGGPEVEARKSRLQNALIGAGDALNGDHARRSELLGLYASEDDAVAHVSNVDAATLGHLLTERFVHPESRAGDGPDAIELLGFVADWPECRLEATVVGASRDDTRIVFDGLHADLTRVAKSRRQPLRRAFSMFAEGANRLDLEEDDLYASWE